eukprot:gnl/TRDRNA2_/TRDRNA2_202216_c0_seq1.p2 gnl/TRDRNA2_/TRDRNA2_202216_c0~~gnl/TRDRNA2_/TRDRNA2_202216_c0_seq1.p2  ORF type:complete len:151 (+),score=24.08 gnl/TRDRNA2_/TRDRNA2_202216_c0_seq1:47-499(+)
MTSADNDGAARPPARSLSLIRGAGLCLMAVIVLGSFAYMGVVGRQAATANRVSLPIMGAATQSLDQVALMRDELMSNRQEIKNLRMAVANLTDSFVADRDETKRWLLEHARKMRETSEQWLADQQERLKLELRHSTNVSRQFGVPPEQNM